MAEHHSSSGLPEGSGNVTSLWIELFKTRFCPKGYCVRGLQRGSRKRMCESCLSDVHSICTMLVLKSVILDILCTYFKCKIQETCWSFV